MCKPENVCNQSLQINFNSQDTIILNFILSNLIFMFLCRIWVLPSIAVGGGGADEGQSERRGSVRHVEHLLANGAGRGGAVRTLQSAVGRSGRLRPQRPRQPAGGPALHRALRQAGRQAVLRHKL